MTLATSWQRSVAVSSSSNTAFSLMTWRVSASSRNNGDRGAIRSASDSSLSISSQITAGSQARSPSPRLGHRTVQALAAAQRLGEQPRLLGHAADVVEDHRLARVLDQVEHVVHARDQAVDVVAVEGA